MPGPLALVGSGEFLPSTADVDHALVDFGTRPRVAIVPTASGAEGDESVNRWIGLGLARYTELGADPVAVPAIDRASADDPGLAEEIDAADLVYFSGGDPVYVIETMRDSLVWAAVLRAWARGAALAGCSAGAMMMGSVTVSPRHSGVHDGLGLVRRLCVIPHFDRMHRFRPSMVDDLLAAAPRGTVVVGVEEDTGLVHDGAAWSVRGRQRAWLIEPGDRTAFDAGETVPLEVRFRGVG